MGAVAVRKPREGKPADLLYNGGLYSGRAALRAPDRKDGWQGYGRDIWQAALLLIELERYGPTP